jgi:hypothetical protein
MGATAGVATHSELRALGVPTSTITYRIRPAGPWQRILPGVVLTHRGTPTTRERGHAALKYCGDGAVLTGLSSLSRRGYRTPSSTREHVLVEHRRQRSSRDWLTVERTTRMPPTTIHRGLPCAFVARALVDACRRMERLDDVRELVAEVIQQNGCSVRELADEVRRGARRGSGLTREVLREMAAGIRSVAEARARVVLARHGVTAPTWNAVVETPDGAFLGIIDAYWEHVAAALEIDSMAWHLRPSAYKRTQRRQRRLITRGVLVMPVAPGDVIDNEDSFVRDVLDLLAEAARREPPALVVRRQAA